MGSKAKTDPKPERVPWDGLRFLKQTSQFITMPNPLARFDASKQPVLVNPGDVIWEPNSASNPFAWAPLDDVVMGGASQSGFNAATGIWKGTVTSANNGGFVGIRTTPFSPPLDLRNCQGIELRIQNGNGKRYKAIVRDSTDFNGVCWTSSFDTVAATPFFLGGKTRPSVIRLPLNKLIPTIFARTVPDQVLNIHGIVAFQLAYSKVIFMQHFILTFLYYFSITHLCLSRIISQNWKSMEQFEYDGKLNSKFELGDFSLQLLEVRAY